MRVLCLALKRRAGFKSGEFDCGSDYGGHPAGSCTGDCFEDLSSGYAIGEVRCGPKEEAVDQHNAEGDDDYECRVVGVGLYDLRSAIIDRVRCGPVIERESKAADGVSDKNEAIAYDWEDHREDDGSPKEGVGDSFRELLVDGDGDDPGRGESEPDHHESAQDEQEDLSRLKNASCDIETEEEFGHGP